MILILTQSTDGTADAVCRSLKSKGARFVRIDTADFPQRIGISLALGPEWRDLIVTTQDVMTIDMHDIRTVWYRRPAPPEPTPALSAEDHSFAQRESAHVLRALWSMLGDRFWVNPWAKSLVADHKPYQLQVAYEVGLDIPRTLITNDPNRALDFFDLCEGATVYKPLVSYQSPVEMTKETPLRPRRGAYTNALTREQLLEGLERIKFSPCLFQEYIPKKVELRVTVIGHRMFVAEIHSQESRSTKVDWRHPSPEPLRYSVGELPGRTASRIRCLMQRLGLVFGAIDLIMTPEGRIVFLEVNPSGQWYWIELATGLPILSNFSEMLIQGKSDYVEAREE